MNWLVTGNYLIVHSSSSKPSIFEKGSEIYDKVLDLLTYGAPDETIKSAIYLGREIESYSEGTFKVDSDSGEVFIDGERIVDVIAKKILEFCNAKLPYLPLVNFWRNIQQNPSEESKSHLFLFLAANEMPITHDGCFMAYKKVVANDNGDLVDARSKTFCNNVGAVVVMDRANVNPDRTQTCSAGLHVASYDYAQNSYSGSHLLEVKINPRDVVAVPEDYDNQKMRVCRYEVVGITQIDSLDDVLLVPETEIEQKVESGKKQLVNEKVNIKVNRLSSAVLGDYVDVSDEELPARAIIEVVKHLTGEEIEISLKNKKSIVKKAKNILAEAGYRVE